MKRIMPRARGVADRIRKRTSHITVVVAERGVARQAGSCVTKGDFLWARRYTRSGCDWGSSKIGTAGGTPDKKEYAELLHEDLEIRRRIKERFYTAGISKVEIERAANRAKVTIHTARPGMVIGKGGAEVDRLRKELEQRTGKQLQINIVEVKRPELDAQLVAENIAFQLETAGLVPPGDEAGPSSGPCAWAPWASRSGFRSARRRGDRPRPSGRRKDRFPSTRCGRISTTVSPRPRRPTGKSASRFGFTKAKCCRKRAVSPSSRKRKGAYTRC